MLNDGAGLRHLTVTTHPGTSTPGKNIKIVQRKEPKRDLAWDRLYPPLERVKYPNKHMIPAPGSGIHDPRATQKYLAMKIQQVLNKPELRVARQSWSKRLPQDKVKDWLEECFQ